MIELHNTECLAFMKTLPDNSVDAVITDPPYYSTSLHFDKEPKLDFLYFLNECKRVLKPAGVLVSFADFNLLAELRSYSVFKSTYELIWQKNRAANFMTASKMPMRVHEYIGIFKDKTGSYNPQRIPRSESSLKRHPAGRERIRPTGGNCAVFNTNRLQSEIIDKSGLKNPISILPFKVPQGSYGTAKHPTQKPLDLLEWLVKSYTNENDLIFDPFAGSGTTLVAAKKLNRRAMGCELHRPYFDIAQVRIQNTLL